MAKPGTQKWFVLGTFALTSGFQGFFCMDFASCSEVAKEAFRVDTEELNMLYSAILLTTLPTIFAASYYIDRKHFCTSLVAPMSNLIAAWLRYLAIIDRNYAMALLSSVISGVGAGVMICSFVPLATRWFPHHQRTLAVTLAVQSNYGGWAIGALILPLVVSTTADLRHVLKTQALFATVNALAFLAFHREKPASLHAVEELPEDHANVLGMCTAGGTVELPSESKLSEDLSVYDSMERLFSSKKVVVQLLVFSLMGGISFAIPGIQDGIFTDGLGESNLIASQRSATNFSFILSGVLMGILLGAVISKPHQRVLVIKVLLVVSSVSLSALSMVVFALEGGGNSSLKNSSVFGVIFGFMSFAGIGLISFIGLALGMIVETAHPVPHAYSAGALEWFLQTFGAVHE
jgi:hypothetical protein